MTYPLSPVQKRILADNAEDVNFAGDDNDFSCLLGVIATRLFLAGDRSGAWACFQNDPLATYGATYEAWEKGMLENMMTHLRNELAVAAPAARPTWW